MTDEKIRDIIKKIDEPGMVFLQTAVIMANSKKDFIKQMILAKKIYLNPVASIEEKAKAFLWIGLLAMVDDIRKGDDA